MELVLDRVSKTVGADVHLHPIDLPLRSGAVNVLLGPNLAGKTSLLRLLAGLDRPSGGRIVCDGRDITGRPVGARDVAMVYQRFINYPSLTVFENIAAPLRNAGCPSAEVEQRVRQMAETLRLGACLDRHPGELSGGQQQRTALARALVKRAGLLLLDEPLVNLDFKLREELRAELQALFAARDTTVVYATSLPEEALQLGGYTAVLDQGHLLQQGPTLEVFERPQSLAAARAFSDPPLNLLPAVWVPAAPSGGPDGACHLRGSAGEVPVTLPGAARAKLAGAAPGELTLAVRPHRLRLERRRMSEQTLEVQVDLAEITGSETFVHVSRGDLALILQVPGVHALEIGQALTVYFDPRELHGFDREGRLLFAPSPVGELEI